MRYLQRYSNEIEAIQWTGDNFSEVTKVIGWTKKVVSLHEEIKCVTFGKIKLLPGQFLCKELYVGDDGETVFNVLDEQLFNNTYERADDDSSNSKDDLIALIKDIKAWDVETSMDEGKPDFFALPIELRQRIQKAIERAE